MEIYYPYLDEYTKFMMAFKTYHEELYNKYQLMVEMDFESTGRVKLRQDVTIGPLTKIALTHIIKEYYVPFDN